MSKNAVCYTVILICLFTAACFAKYSGGTGEPNDPYLIATPNDLNAIGADPNDWDKHFKMIANLDMNSYSKDEINTIGGGYSGFKGVFDGRGYTISNLNLRRGLFKRVNSDNAEIRNLFLENITVDQQCALVEYLDAGKVQGCQLINVTVNDGMATLIAHNYDTVSKCSVIAALSGDSLGGLVGHNLGTIAKSNAVVDIDGFENCGGLVGYNEGSILDCHVLYATVTGYRYLGGLVGRNWGTGTIYGSSAHAHVENTGAWSGTGGLVGLNSGDIVRSTSSGTVVGGHHLGGLVGDNYGIIYACYSKSQATGNYRIGALVGRNYQIGLVSNCYSLGSAFGESSVGGLVGRNEGAATRCYEAGKVSGSNWVGGFIGYQDSIISIDGFWDKTLNPDKKSIGNSIDTRFPEVIGLSTVEMKSKCTFTNAGWDMVNVWDMGENQTYPFLRTHLPSDINKDNKTNFLDLAILTENWLDEK